MKNPLAYLKHIVKDPINTIAEADARKKEIMPLFYGSACILAVGLILQVAAKLDFMAAVSFIGLVGVALCGFLFLIIKKAKERFTALTCDSCHTMADIKTPEDFAKYVSFAVMEDRATFKEDQHSKISPTNGVHSLVKISASSVGVVSVDITCPNCGSVKHLVYETAPFKCHIEQKNVRVVDYNKVYAQMADAVRAVVNEYNNPETRKNIPYTLHSSKNPNFETRYTFKGANASDARPVYNGVKLDIRQDIEEMVEHYFVIPQINGTLTATDKK